jgi:small-conductance mechanosensitive channel
VAIVVNGALREAGVEIPFPQRDLHLRSVDEGATAALTRTSTPGPAMQD